MTILKDRPRTAGAGRRGPGAGRLVALLILVATCWVTLLATTPSPAGNPVLRTTSPGNAEAVKSPDEVRLTFDRPVPAGLATMRIIDPPGDQIVFDRPVHPDGRADTISVPMPKTRYEGTYTVAWTLPSSQLQPISGSFSFDVANTIPPLGVPEIETTHDTTITAFYTTMRIVALAAMALLVGAAFFVAAIGQDAAQSVSARRVIKYSWLGLVVATLGTLMSFGPYAAWAPLNEAFDARLLSGTFESDLGGALLARLAVLVPVTLGLAQLMTGPAAETARERWIRGGSVLACAAALLATWTFTEPRPQGTPTPLTMTMDLVLITAIALSVGCLVMLWLSRTGDRAVVSRFARLSVVCAGMLGIAATYQAWRAPHGIGWLSIGTLVLSAVLLGVALLGVAWLRRTPEDTKRERRAGLSRFRRLLLGATGLAGLVLGGTVTMLVIQPSQAADPPAAIRQQVAPTRLAFDTGKPGGQGSVDLVLIPATTGQHEVRLDAHVSVASESGSARDDLAVTAVFDRPDHTAPPVPVPLGRAGTGYLAGSATVPGHGGWELALTLQAGDGSRQTITQPLDVR
jgi:copper transport protein